MARSKIKKGVALVSVALLLLAELRMFDDFFYPFRYLWDEGRVGVLVLVSIGFVWSLLGTFLLFFSERTLFRKVTLPFFLFFMLFNIGTYDIASSPLDFQQAVIIVENFQWWTWAVVENFGLALLPGIIIFVPFIILVERLPDLSTWHLSKKAYLVPVSALILVFIGMQYTQGLFDRYPSFFRIPSILLLAAQSDLYDGGRSKVVYSGALDAQVEKIVLIVDESIRADLMSINGTEKSTTPYLGALDSGIVDLGLAASSSNCSDYSNLILRTGVRKEEVPDEDQMSLKQPSIWQFMKKAGFYNVYLDAQSAAEQEDYQNFMNEHEAAYIDEIQRLRQKVAYESDGVARKKLADLLRRPGKTFVMMNKYGIHFPYYRSYPSSHELFTPVLGPGDPMRDRARSLNTYRNGMRWSVDEWFKGLLSESEAFQPYVIIYTSDHGQNIVDDGTLATHCRPKANRYEGMVPMMLFSNDAMTLELFNAARMSSHDKTDHFQIFPTLIRLAGYEGSWVREHYGASLSESPDTSPEFFVGDIHGRGSVRRWVSIFPEGADNDDGLNDR
jgi:glucan phosphoethanolaminetransferase (alkaline phosphatase superfamily)